VWHLLEGQGWLYEAWGSIATTMYSRVEVGWYKLGLHCGFASDGPQVWFNLGDRRPTLQIHPLHIGSHQLQCLEVCRDLHRSRAMLALSSKDDNLRPRFTVCRSLLGATAHIPRNSPYPQFGLSPKDWWPNWASQPNTGRYAKSLCFGTTRKLGSKFTLG
jgi:hypothetical protein